MEIKQLVEQTEQLVKEIQIIANNLADYNPGLCKDKIPLPTIQYNLACLARELTDLHGEIGEKIRK